MPKFRKKPVVIEAVRYRAGEQPGEFAADVIAGNIRYPEDGTMLIKTLEGEMCAQPGDWIIRGVKGELYPCKPDIFAATYEPAEGTSAAEVIGQALGLLASTIKSGEPWSAACEDAMACARDALAGRVQPMSNQQRIN